MAAKKAATGSSILQAARDIAASDGCITRQGLLDSTGYAATIIDDHIKRLAQAGDLVRIAVGVYRVEDRTPERPVSVTSIPGGGRCHTIEIGDTVAKLTSREARQLGRMLAGFAMGVAA